MPTGSIERISDTLAMRAQEDPFGDWAARRSRRHLDEFDAEIAALSRALARYAPDPTSDPTSESTSEDAAWGRLLDTALAGLGSVFDAAEVTLCVAPTEATPATDASRLLSPTRVWTRCSGIRVLSTDVSSVAPVDLAGLGRSGRALCGGEVVHTAPFDAQIRPTGWRRSRSTLLVPCPGPTGLLAVLRIEAGLSGARWSHEHVQKAELFGQILGGGLARRRLENELDERQREQAHGNRLEALGRVASSVAHDFNNLITAILGYTDLLEMDIAENGTGDVELAEIREAALRAAGLVEQVLGFGRAREIGAQRVDLSDTVTNLEGMLRQVLGPDIALDLALPAAPRAGERRVCVRLDPGRLGPVLLNLASNARGALEGRTDDPRFALAIDRVRVDTDEPSPASVAEIGKIAPGDYVRLTARDNGCGLSRDVAARIFEPFFTTKKPGSGTGLGLASAAEFTLQAGGGIRVESRPDEGASFQLFFPVDSAPVDSPIS